MSGGVTDYTQLPENLPVPVDDGAADHLPGQQMPDLALPSTTGRPIVLRRLGAGPAIIYIYPLTGRPGHESPQGWDEIPGARGCTTEACDFRDHYRELIDAGASAVYGLSAQATAYQQELVERLRLPFAMLADPELRLAHALELPIFQTGGQTLYKRMTLVIRRDAIEHVFYPVFPPNEHARELLEWLRSRSAAD
jgi:peroxiredoxin